MMVVINSFYTWLEWKKKVCILGKSIHRNFYDLVFGGSKFGLKLTATVGNG